MSDNSTKAKKSAVVLLSGGLDSMVTAALALEQGFAIHAVTIDYGQRHRRELEAARRIAKQLNVARHIELQMDMRAIGGSALTDLMDVPKDGVGDSIPVTYVPARNLIFLSVCVAAAEAAGASDVFIGVNALDYSGYPDCRPEFISSFAETARLGTKSGVEGEAFVIHAPLQEMTKADIARECVRLGLEPSNSWSCYDPTEDGLACGLCDSCRLRKKGFAEAGLTDSTAYAD
ncbi:7-cyano-7-deazaguanine synthase QueC [Altererythrobacter sp.]|uniref:7-cyano-7-deazaguanine synthase QueC n=1 Tax=Altererythrobacter sp. TaxID=1872480 RepID=UPI001B0E7ECD|nr:7-cyano-7-deazaguanine synthase QueC [Altererythrobacter sp.]MBO6608431.1 7-cyano-7-deazaguanine synthase QueC [Altererythrobacter sp.]MBO6642055.1 7-cyano-7-deazaguanine synthase QueC [Altererythrobacter sp.]MBO6709437.1 7-cyano-7-deazaguanine synthase QueC [Altererythrobacter sp.]MBO6944456.1 7-cyano-7-deazaguanine synthase QueC [Altererythrobacter sp.]